MGAGLAHAYERHLPAEGEVYCNFYIRRGRVPVASAGAEPIGNSFADSLR